MNSLYQSLRKLRADDHKMRMTPDMIADFKWWLSCLHAEAPAWRALWPPTKPSIQVETDSCLATGGAFLKHNSAWIYTNWAIDRPNLINAHINIKELAMIREALACWGPCFPNHCINVFCDNVTAVYAVNTGASSNPLASKIIKGEVFRTQ